MKTFTPAKPRIVLYSHDTMGFGHIRRNLLIAQVLVAPPLEAEVLLIAGVREASAFAMPAGVDCLTLPAYRKDKNGSYHARSLDLDVQSLVALRAATIEAALKSFEPDLLVVDNVPRGVMGELAPALTTLRRKGRTRCALGLRDVLDDPESVRRQWWRQRNFEAVTKCYDAIWVYGDPKLYDTATEYGFDAGMREKLSYTGYLDQGVRLESADPSDPITLGYERSGEPYILCAVGGGQDGMAVTEAFAAAELPHGHRGVIVTGPFMPAEARSAVAAVAAHNPRLDVLQFVAEPSRLMKNAERIVAMGGYNTIMELLSFGKRALVAPRVTPRTEQLIRAERLEALGLIDLVRPDALTADTLSAWLNNPMPAPPAARKLLDLDGLSRLPRLVEDLLEERRLIATMKSHPFEADPDVLHYATA